MWWKRKPPRLLTGQALRNRARELGVPLVTEDPGLVGLAGAGDLELQRRVMEAERHFHEMRMARLTMNVAIVSALIALAAAAAAWWPIFHPPH